MHVPEVILVVEDDHDFRICMTEVLEDHGYVSVGVSNGREALDYLRNHPAPALILLDLWMPIMDGQTFRFDQRRDPRLAAIPVVILSGTSDRVRLSDHLQPDGYLNKPFRTDDLLATVRKYAHPRRPLLETSNLRTA